ncbi:hypothetical protein PGR10_05365 [Klebsiella sp. 141198]|uniref:hypothetical protein n=1 Tax=Klebsiella sp. 141198 TaxID=3020036 RepID=UPI003D3271C8
MAVLVTPESENDPEWPSKKKWFNASKWLSTPQYIKIRDYYVINTQYAPIDVDSSRIISELQEAIKSSKRRFLELTVLSELEWQKFHDVMKYNHYWMRGYSVKNAGYWHEKFPASYSYRNHLNKEKIR